MKSNRCAQEFRPTVQMSREELDVMLHIERAVALRENPHNKPTVQMPAVNIRKEGTT